MKIRTRIAITGIW